MVRTSRCPRDVPGLLCDQEAEVQQPWQLFGPQSCQECSTRVFPAGIRDDAQTWTSHCCQPLLGSLCLEYLVPPMFSLENSNSVFSLCPRYSSCSHLACTSKSIWDGEGYRCSLPEAGPRPWVPFWKPPERSLRGARWALDLSVWSLCKVDKYLITVLYTRN